MLFQMGFNIITISTLCHYVYMSHVSATPSTVSKGAMQSQGSGLALYEAAASDVSDDTTGSAIIRRIMVITQAATDGGASEAGMGEEDDVTRSQGVPTDAEGGTDEARTVLAGANT